MTRSLWQALLFAGVVGFSCALGVHFTVGYLDALHLSPAVAGAAIYLVGIIASASRRESIGV